MKRYLYAGYRSWALDAFELSRWIEHAHSVSIDLVTSHDDLCAKIRNNDYEAAFLAGWSWIVPPDVCSKTLVVGVHPSDLPEFAGGSPLQNQIMQGITRSKVSIFRITPELDAGGVLMKKDLSLDGNIADIFERLTNITSDLFEEFIVKHITGTLVEEVQDASKRHVWKRLKPAESALTVEKFQRMTAQQLYDFIRCHTDPYPNVFVEDGTGRLEIKIATFTPKPEKKAT